MARKKETKKRGTESHGKIISKEKAPKSLKSQSPGIKTPSPPTTGQNNSAIVEIPLIRLKALNLKNNATLKSLNKLFKAREENSQYELTDAELDRTQWFFEYVMSCIVNRKKIVDDVLNSLKLVQSSRSQNPSAIRPRAVEKTPFVNEVREIKSSKKPLTNKKKTETENKFWSMVKPYLAHVNKKDLDWLEELVLSYDSRENVCNIPPLGEHYSKAGMLKRQYNQSPCSQPDKKIFPNVVELVDQINHIAINHDSFRPVYQKVASALLEHSSMPSKYFDEQLLDDEIDEDKFNEMSDAHKKIYFNAKQNVKKKFRRLGLQPPLPTTKDDDEILDELNKCNSTLAELQEVNKNQLTNLLKKCYQDYFQQPIREKIEKVDEEILSFKRKPNTLLSNDEKLAQFSEENDEMALLTSKRSKYVSQLQLNVFDPDFGNFFSDDSESGDEESNPFQEHFKITPTKNVFDVHHITDDELEH